MGWECGRMMDVWCGVHGTCIAACACLACLFDCKAQMVNFS